MLDQIEARFSMQKYYQQADSDHDIDDIISEAQNEQREMFVIYCVVAVITPCCRLLAVLFITTVYHYG